MFLTYSTTGRATSGSLGMLDMTPYGRGEAWEDNPEGLARGTQPLGTVLALGRGGNAAWARPAAAHRSGIASARPPCSPLAPARPPPLTRLCRRHRHNVPVHALLPASGGDRHSRRHCYLEDKPLALGVASMCEIAKASSRFELLAPASRRWRDCAAPIRHTRSPTARAPVRHRG
ncbi:hypothetical protein AB0E01_13410 [Nocardia vinacea]|uniref:hypothetical protein n=1 Tax=Nocardia vinacea TaxID=96468 RepID=UPI00340C81B1